MKCLLVLAVAVAAAYATNPQACVQDCTRPFLQAVQTFDTGAICNGFSNYNRCIHRCPHGAEIWRLAKAKDPRSFQQLESSCSRG